MVDSNDWHWRNSMRPTRFFMIDARAALGVLLVIVHIRLWTIMLALLVIGGFWLAERANYSLDATLRKLRTLIVGPKRPAVALRSKRVLIDYGK